MRRVSKNVTSLMPIDIILIQCSFKSSYDWMLLSLISMVFSKILLYNHQVSTLSSSLWLTKDH